jgi:hypothetical protein
MRSEAGSRALLAAACALALTSAHGAVHTAGSATALARQLLAPGTALAVIDTPSVTDLAAAGIVDPGGTVVLSTGLASEIAQPAAARVNHAFAGRPGLTFLEGIAGAAPNTGRDAIMFDLVLKAGAHTTAARVEYRFATEEPAGNPPPTAFNDAFAVRLFRGASGAGGANIALHQGMPVTVNTAPLTAGSLDVFDRSTGVQALQFDLSPGEEFRLIFMLSDIGSGVGDSAVYLSNLQAIPEPSALALLAAGLLGVTWRAARTRAAARSSGT